MAKNEKAASAVKWRTIVSLFTVWMFFVLGVTGLVLYVVPQGRIAYWVDWRFLGLTKTDWGNIHVVTSILFIVVSGFHLYFNWRAFLKHLRQKIAQSVKVRKELVITVAVTLFVVLSGLWQIPPVGYLVELNDMIKSSWIEDESYEPPFGHAELLSMKMFCKKTGINLEKALQELQSAGIETESSAQTLEEIAKKNGISPKDVFAKIAHLKKEKRVAAKATLTVDDVFERFEGTGLGKKTVPDACEMAGHDLEQCSRRLQRHDVSWDADETVKTVADRAGMRPIQVLQKMLVD